MADGNNMRLWGLSAALLLAVFAAGCGGNKTTIGVVVAPTIQAVAINGSLQFSASVTGGSTTTVNWQVCVPGPPTTVKGITTNPPANCGSGNLGTVTSAGLYTAPAVVPSPSTVDVVATSTIDATAFGVGQAVIDCGVRVTLLPTSATIPLSQPGQPSTFQFTPTITGSNNKAVTWTVSNVAGGNSIFGTITPNGLYTAPSANPGSAITVTATAGACSAQSASASVTLVTPAPPAVTSIDPTVAAQGSVQQDVYVIGTDFISTDGVLANSVLVPSVFISTTLLRATVPAASLQTTGIVSIQVQRGKVGVGPTAQLTVNPTRPSIIASSPDSVSQTNAGVGVNLTGGFYTPATVAFFNGLTPAQQAAIIPGNSRQMIVDLPASSLSMPGLYPLIVQSPDALSAGIPSIAATNIAVEPSPASIPTSAPLVSVGSQPSAVAIDTALGEAVVANTGSNSVSIVNIAGNSLVANVAVGSSPTGVAVDDVVSPNIALVVNSKDNTVSTINLTTNTLAGPPLALPSGFVPISIGINPLTHRAIVANQSTNTATVLDVSSGAPVVVQQITGSPVLPFSTGANPRIAIDPRLNWAVLTPGGGGTIDLVDLGRGLSPGDPAGRTPELVGTFGLSSTVQGVGINAETHTALFTDPNASTLTTFSLLNNATNSISFAQAQPGFVAAAANSLANVGIAVNGNSGTAAIVDLENNIPLRTVTVGNSPQAVAIDPATETAVVANRADGTVSIVSLAGPTVRTLQIVEASPAIAFADASSPLTLTINGNGFAAGVSQVLLDDTALPAGSVNVVSARQIIATIPGTMLGAAHRYIVTVENPAGPVPNILSNATDLTVIQPVIVGSSPVGVSIDTDRDLAVVTNSGDNTVSLVNLLTGTTISPSPVPVGQSPLGVATLPRLGLAVVANNGSNNATVVDETGVNGPVTVQLCNGCSQPAGVAINQDTGDSVIPNEAIVSPSSGAPCNPGAGIVSFVSLSATGGTFAGDTCVDQSPNSAAVDPGLNIAAIGTSSQTSSLDLITVGGAELHSIQNFQNPSGMVFDPVNQVFVIANSLANNIVILDPSTFIPIVASVGINPTSLDYNFQTSTLVLANNGSNTISFVAYVCPPNGTSPGCLNPQVRDVLGLTASQQFSVSVDPKLNLAAVADQNNNRVLLVPLP
ncbi:MAG: hypothetical protein ACRD4S_03245 [Candidatus Acidiferrales bacterium]